MTTWHSLLLSILAVPTTQECGSAAHTCIHTAILVVIILWRMCVVRLGYTVHDEAYLMARSKLTAFL